jgi:hypothetical protein
MPSQLFAFLALFFFSFVFVMPRVKLTGPCAFSQLLDTHLLGCCPCHGTTFKNVTPAAYAAIPTDYLTLELDENGTKLGECVQDAQLCSSHFMKLCRSEFQKTHGSPSPAKRLKDDLDQTNYTSSPSRTPGRPRKVLSPISIAPPRLDIAINRGVELLAGAVQVIGEKLTYIPYEWNEFLLEVGKVQPDAKAFAVQVYHSMGVAYKAEITRLSLQKKAITALMILTNGFNRVVRDFQRENGLANKSKMTTDALFMAHNQGTMSHPTTIDEDQRAISKAHEAKVKSFLAWVESVFIVGGLDDFNVVWELKQAEVNYVVKNGAPFMVVKTHNVLHMATATARPTPFPAVIVPPSMIFNSATLDIPGVIAYLLTNMPILSLSYNQAKLILPAVTGAPFPLPEGQEETLTFQLLTHHYDEAVQHAHQQRLLRQTQLIDCFGPHPLKSLANYIAALQAIADKGLYNYLMCCLYVLVCDFPGQYHVRKAVMHNSLGDHTLPDWTWHLISLLGPLHVSLNAREMVVMKYQAFLWLRFYQAVFGANKKLAKKPKPWRISLILVIADGAWRLVRQYVVNAFGNCDDPEYLMYFNLLDNVVPLVLDIYAVLFKSGNLESYLLAVLRVTLALFNPMNRRNYNKIAPAYVSDILRWKSLPVNHPLHQVYLTIEACLVHFDDWWPEGFHSLFRRRINPGATAETVHREARCADRALHDGSDFVRVFGRAPRWAFHAKRVKTLFPLGAEFFEGSHPIRP